MFYRIVQEKFGKSYDIYQTTNYALIGVQFYELICDFEGRDHLSETEFERYVKEGYEYDFATYHVNEFENPEDADTLCVEIGDSMYGTTDWNGFYKLAYYHKDVKAYVADVDVTPEMQDEEYY